MTLCAHNAAVTFFGADPLEDLEDEIEIGERKNFNLDLAILDIAWRLEFSRCVSRNI